MGAKGGVSLQLPLTIQRNHPQCTMWAVLIELHRCEKKSTERRHFSTKFVCWYVLLKITEKWCLSTVGNLMQIYLLQNLVYFGFQYEMKCLRGETVLCLRSLDVCYCDDCNIYPPVFHCRQKRIATRKIMPSDVRWSLYDLNWKYRREIRIAFNFRYLQLVISTALWSCVWFCKFVNIFNTDYFLNISNIYTLLTIKMVSYAIVRECH